MSIDIKASAPHVSIRQTVNLTLTGDDRVQVSGNRDVKGRETEAVVVFLRLLYRWSEADHVWHLDRWDSGATIQQRLRSGEYGLPKNVSIDNERLAAITGLVRDHAPTSTPEVKGL